MHTDHIAQDMKLLHIKGKLENILYNLKHNPERLTKQELVNTIEIIKVRIEMLVATIG
jgi:hypothetical protein